MSRRARHLRATRNLEFLHRTGDAGGIRLYRPRVAGYLPAIFHRRLAKSVEQDTVQRTVHGLGHQLVQQGTCGTKDRTRNNHRWVLKDETLESYGQTGQCVVFDFPPPFWNNSA